VLSEQYFQIYYELGAERSLQKLTSFRGELGLPYAALSTLTKWSSDFGWQARVIQLDAFARKRAADNMERRRAAQLERQAVIGHAMQNIGAQGLEVLQKDRQRISDLGVGDLVQLVREGQKIENLATGLATERVEVAVGILTAIVYEVVALFERVNPLEDPEQRKVEFAGGFEELVDRKLALEQARR
jgi:hypothetical protein